MKRVELNEQSLVRYGVNSELASRAAGNGLAIGKIKALSVAELTSLYMISAEEAAELKRCVVRAPIDKEIANQLLSASNFSCNLCKGNKGHTFIIHHITPYEQTQDNSYDNLIVLCPSDHDIAHRPGALTLGITKPQLIAEKAKWEDSVRIININAATRAVDVAAPVSIRLNRDEDVLTLKYLMYFIPFTSLLSHIYNLPSAFNIDFLDVATHMETLMLDRPHGYPFTDPLLQATYNDYLGKYVVLFHLLDKGTNGIPHFLSADDDLSGKFMARRNYRGFSFEENNQINQAIESAKVQFADAYLNLISFLRNNYPEVALGSYKPA